MPKFLRWALAALFFLLTVAGCGGTGNVPESTLNGNPSAESPAGGNNNGEQALGFNPAGSLPGGVGLEALRAKGFSDPKGVLELGKYDRSEALAITKREISRLRNIGSKAFEEERAAARAACKSSSASSEEVEYEFDLDVVMREGTLSNGQWAWKMYALPVEHMKPMSYVVSATGSGELWIIWSDYSNGKWSVAEKIALDGTAHSVVVNSDYLEASDENQKSFSRYPSATAWVVLMTSGEVTPLKLGAMVRNSFGDPSFPSPRPWLPTASQIGLAKDLRGGKAIRKTASLLNEDQDIFLDCPCDDIDPFDPAGSPATNLANRGMVVEGVVPPGETTRIVQKAAEIGWVIDDEDVQDSHVPQAIPGATYRYSRYTQAGDGDYSATSYFEDITIPFLFTATLTASASADGTKSELSWTHWYSPTGTGITEYRVFRNNGEEPVGTVVVEDEGQLTYDFTDDSPPIGRVNLYTVKAVNAYGISSGSNVAKVAYYPKTRVTGFGFDCSQGPTALAYKTTGEPVVVFTNTSEGTTDLKVGIATSSEPTATGDFTVSTIATNVGYVHRLEMAIYDDDKIVIVYATDTGLFAAVSAVVGPTGPSDWIITTIDGNPLAKAGQTYLVMALINGNPAVVYNQSDYTAPPTGMYYVSSNVPQPDSDDDWAGRHRLLSGIGLAAQLSLVSLDNKPALGICPRLGTDPPQIWVANVSNPVSYEDWNNIRADIYTSACLGLDLQVEGTILKAVVVPANSTDVGAGLTSADLSDGFTGWPEDSLIPAAVEQSQRGWCKLLQINNLQMICTYKAAAGGWYGLSFSLTATPSGIADWVQDNSPWANVPDSQSVAQGVNHIGFAEVMPNNDLRFSWIGGNT
jgi:hypothetical protein